LEVWSQTTRNLLAYFAPERELQTISEGDAEDFKLFLIGEKLAATTVHKRLQFARMFFRDAVKRKLVAVNPFAEVSAKAVLRPDRQHYVSRADAEKLLAVCDPTWRTIIGLARYAGLRTPSETLSLRWQDVDWEHNRITVQSPKTAHHVGKASRTIPIFAELRPILTEAFELAPDGAVYVVGGGYRDAANTPSGWRNCNLRTQFGRIILRAGLTPWPRLLHALRASCETELAAEHPLHVVTQWLGNTPRIAMQHYLTVTQADLDKAIGKGGAECGALGAQNAAQQVSAPIGAESQESKLTPTGLATYAKKSEGVRTSAQTFSGEDRNLSSHFPQLLPSLQLASQVLKRQALSVLWLVMVVGCCFGLSGNVFSTLSAHSSTPNSASLPVPGTLNLGPSNPPTKRGRRSRRSLPSDVAASYARYSSDKQYEESLLDQQRKCREKAVENSHQIPIEFEFSDSAVRSTKLHREGLDAMLLAAEEGHFSVLYFYSLSRLAREQAISIPVLKRLVHRFGIRLIVVADGIDSNDSTWELVATIYGIVNQQFLTDLSANAFRGLEGSLLSGRSIGDHCLGYKSVTDGPVDKQAGHTKHKPARWYEIDEAEAAWVRKIFAWFVNERRRISWITKKLNNLGAPKDHRSSRPNWHRDSVITVLTNPKYVGIPAQPAAGPAFAEDDVEKASHPTGAKG
jgi:DNA invertase Pin-like site-specific DNA recombinase/integrase